MPSPSFSFSQITILAQELQEKLTDAVLISCTFVHPKKFWLNFHKEDHPQALLWCFEQPFVRFHLSRYPFQKALPFSSLQSELAGLTLTSVDILNQDRILKLSFASADRMRVLIGEFFSKHPNYYLINEEGNILFSLFPLSSPYYRLPPPVPIPSSSSSSPLPNSESVEQAYRQLEREWEFEKEKKAVEARLLRMQAHLKRKKTQLESQWQACSTWEKVKHEGELIKAHFAQLKKGLSHLEVWDWLVDKPYTLILNPTWTPQEEMAHRFKRAKKLQAGLSHMAEQINKTEQALLKNEQALEEVERIQTKEELLRLFSIPARAPAVKKQTTPLPPYREYVSSSGLLIWVGRNAKANDSLTFRLARGSDWWLHAQGFPGSHVLIRTQKGQDPDPDAIADAIQLALYHSQAKERQEAEICLTQRKYVSRLGKGQPGKVQISKHKTIWARFDPQRYQAIKQRRQLNADD
ncbi:NFACT RNA binding domain-containing protein [Candidatus Protochlamydia phocaeensis]|uniref:NFACT RNA binding domain-containing protein n=1 Tax=Candidatus Protochlamydia phocaeensis TaxID=1414722 RepID=UPI000837E86A|nr:NFACT RNA binding domain-containing protein [Candidatus Protochlamydia phocaeensis]